MGISRTRSSPILGAGLGLCLLLCLVGWTASAVPLLQEYIEGAVYDTSSETWVVEGSSSAVLWVIGDTGGSGSKGNLYGVKIAVAYDHKWDVYGPTFNLAGTRVSMVPYQTPDGVVDMSTPSSLSVAQSTGTESAPLDGNNKPLPSHGIYGANTSWQAFLVGTLDQTADSVADFSNGFPTSFASGGQINAYDVTVSFAHQPGPSVDLGTFWVHFDVYDHYVSSNKDHYVFAPFSHDGQWDGAGGFRPVPEPLSMVMLGGLGAGMLVVRKVRGRKSS